MENSPPKLQGSTLRTAAALLMFDPIVARAAVRRLLPDGECRMVGGTLTNSVSQVFRQSIKRLEKRGLVQRLHGERLKTADYDALLQLVRASVVDAESAQIVKEVMEQAANKHLVNSPSHPRHPLWHELDRSADNQLAETTTP